MHKRDEIHGILAWGGVGIILCWYFLPALVRAQAGAQVMCDDVSTIDFSNGALDLGGFGLLTFKDGKACGNEEISVRQDRNCDCGSDKCDWRMQIVEDIPLSPEPSISFRLLHISEEHLTGSGAWGHLILFECQEGRLTRILDRQFLYGVKFIQTRNGFELESNHWLSNGARCCPSRKQTETFRWNPRQHRYIRTQSAILRRDAQTH